ncbi:MAG: hypothetical protein WA160_10465 [Pseudobdellovibrio sp.]
MKKFIFICSIALGLTACKQQGDTTTPKGVIIESVIALSEARTQDFLRLLSGRAAEKLSTADHQQQLLNSLGNIKKITLGNETVISSGVFGSSRVTVSEIPVIRGSQTIYNVSVQCIETATSSSHEVCSTHSNYPTEPIHDHNRPPRYHGGNNDSGNNNSDSGSNDSGWITPGDSHEADNSSGPSEDGHKPGNQDPDRPPRLSTNLDYTVNDSTDCHMVYDSNTYTNCKITDLR